MYVCVCGMLRCAVRLHDDYLRNRHKRLLSSCIHYSLLPGDFLVFIFIAVSNPTGSSFSTQCPARKENPASAKIRRCRTGRTRCLACIATGPSKCVPGLLLITKKKKVAQWIWRKNRRRLNLHSASSSNKPCYPEAAPVRRTELIATATRCAFSIRPLQSATTAALSRAAGRPIPGLRLFEVNPTTASFINRQGI